MTQGKPGLSSTQWEANAGKLHARMAGLATYLRCGDDSADIAQEAMLEIERRYRSIESLEELVKVANRICINKVWNLRRQRGRCATVLEDRLQLPSTAPNPEYLLQTEEVRARVRAAIGRCGSRCRQLFILDLQETSTPQICREMGVSTIVLFTLRSRCRAEFRRLWLEDQ